MGILPEGLCFRPQDSFPQILPAFCTQDTVCRGASGAVRPVRNAFSQDLRLLHAGPPTQVVGIRKPASRAFPESFLLLAVPWPPPSAPSWPSQLPTCWSAVCLVLPSLCHYPPLTPSRHQPLLSSAYTRHPRLGSCLFPGGGNSPIAGNSTASKCPHFPHPGARYGN